MRKTDSVEASNADNTAVGENSRKVRNLHYISQIRICEKHNRHLKAFVAYYHETRTHLSLDKDTPASRWVQPPNLGQVVALPQVGGLHHRYERRAA